MPFAILRKGQWQHSDRALDAGMIDICLNIISSRLNEYLQGLFSVSDKLVVLSPLAEALLRKSREGFIS